MKENYIAVFDSGIGGLHVLEELSRNMPNENYIYIGDNENTPYGNLSDFNLLRLSLKCLNVLSGFNVKALVLGCNTLSVSIRSSLSNYFSFPVFGVFPPVERYVVKGERVLLLATPRTIQHFPGYPNLVKVSLPNLAKEIEDNVLNIPSVNIKKHLTAQYLQKKVFDRVILGCTHYHYVKNQILDHFCPKFIDSGNHFTVNFATKFLSNKKSVGKTYRNSILFLGESAKKNEKIYYEVVKKNYFR